VFFCRGKAAAFTNQYPLQHQIILLYSKYHKPFSEQFSLLIRQITASSKISLKAGADSCDVHIVKLDFTNMLSAPGTVNKKSNRSLILQRNDTDLLQQVTVIIE
jgi:hypothetical protein